MPMCDWSSDVCSSDLPWDSPGKNTGVGRHALLQGILPTQGWNPQLSCFFGIFVTASHQYQILFEVKHL